MHRFVKTWHVTPWQGLLAYVLLGALWVFAGDAWLAQVVTDPLRLSLYQSWKGWVYVVWTGLLAWWLLHRARAAERLHHSLTKELGRIAHFTSSGIALVDAQARIHWADERLCGWLQCSLAQLQASLDGKDFGDWVVVQDRDWAAQQLQRLLGGEIEYYQSRRECQPVTGQAAVPVLCTVTRAPRLAGEEQQLICVLTPLGEMEAARAALERSETSLRQAQECQRLAASVVDNTSEGVLVTDAQQRIVSVNAAFTRLLGYSEAELLGQNPRVLQSGRHDAAFYQALWARVHERGHWQGEIWNRRKSGEVFPERMSLSAVRDAQGQVTHYDCVFSDVTEEKQRQAQLQYLAQHDPLTGIYNRHYFLGLLQDTLQQAQASGERLAVLQINMHRFKDINDSFGHAVGDEVYRHAVQQAQGVLRAGDSMGRVTGDELAVLMRGVLVAEQAGDLARQLIAAVAQPWRSPEGLSVVVSASIGISLYPEHGATAEALLQGAHAAGFEAKSSGSGNIGFFRESLTAAAHERLALEAQLRQALRADDGQLQVYYQPQVDLPSGRIIGAEALLRWRNPHTGGFISPAQFIPVAESSGLIAPLGDWVLRQVCTQGQRWRAQGLELQRLAVNVSPRQFRLTDMYASVSAALHDSAYPAQALELEITESVLADDPAKTRDLLLRLRGLGLSIAVDDFGTGYSSLTYLKRFPLDVLKIDQGFIRDIPGDSDDMAISAAIIAMAHSLGLLVLAEGVETPEQLDFLRQHGCDAYQGYLCSRPLPADEFAALLQAR